MAIKRAKTLDDDQFDKLLAYVSKHSVVPERDRLIFLLSFKAGLRSAEIAKIDLTAMTDSSNRIAKNIHIFGNVGKKKRERDIPMHPLIAKALAAFREKFPGAEFVAFSSQPFRYTDLRNGPVPLNAKYRRMSPNAVALYMRDVMMAAGFTGCSSHSGRRTFGTKLAREANLHHCSLRDVQKYMGHARLDTTEKYVDVSEDGRALIAAI